MSSNQDVQGSFSVHVPRISGRTDDAGDDLSDLPCTYFRLGGANPYLPDGDPAAADDNPDKFGVYTYTDGNISQVAKGAEKITLKYAGDSLTTASYEYDQDGRLPQEVKWSRSEAASIGLSDARNVSFGHTCGFGMSSAQSVSASLSFGLTLGLSFTGKCDPLGITLKGSGIEIESPIPKCSFSVNKSDNEIRGLTKVALTAAPHDAATVALITKATIAYQVAAGALSGLCAATYLAQTIAIPAVSKKDGSKNNEVRDALKAMAVTSDVVLSLVTLQQVAGIVLGAAVLVMQKAMKPADMAAAGNLTVTPLAAQLRVGQTSFMSITPASITLCAPTVNICSFQQSNRPVPLPPLPI